MKRLVFLLLPLFVFSYYDFSLRKEADVVELAEDLYLDYYLNPAIITELKERFISFGLSGINGKVQFTNLNFVNPNKIFPYALIFANFETELSSEKNLSFLWAKKGKDYSYGFKFQIGEIKNFYETFWNYEKSEYGLEREGPIGDSSSEEFYLEDRYSSEKTGLEHFSYYQNRSNLFLCPMALYFKLKNLDIGVDFKNSIEKRRNKSERKEEILEIEEEYEYEKRGDTILREIAEYLSREIDFNSWHTQEIETIQIWNKDLSLFLRKKIKGIKDKKTFFCRIGYSSAITKGEVYQKSFDSTYENSLSWDYYYSEDYCDYDSSFYEEGKGTTKESKIMIKDREENFYQEGGLGFNYYFSLFKLDNTLFLGIKEKIDLIRKEEWEKKGKVIFYLGNNIEIGKISFFPIFIPYFTIEEEIDYNYQVFFDLKLKMFDFLNWRFSYLLPGEKEASPKWVLSMDFHY